MKVSKKKKRKTTQARVITIISIAKPVLVIKKRLKYSTIVEVKGKNPVRIIKI